MRTFIALVGILCGVGAFPSIEAYAEGGCPPGMVPFQFAPNQPPSCMPTGGSRSQLPEVWSDRYGAIAADLSLGILSTATDMKSERAANSAVLDDCKAKGGTQCELTQPYRNGCAAVTVGDPNGVNFAAAATIERAIALGVETCTKSGDKNCRTYYSACSFPVRIQ